ncbi:hypothetical protein OAD50_04770 [Vicingaceae bacterium]|nr:hypothetical protein [Vicingaceae bacterium]MDB9964365.1 hypothetical protein [Vicingaceae bacterium]MDC1451755.1 hypothetical protein [Vicingaceae bacterium]
MKKIALALFSIVAIITLSSTIPDTSCESKSLKKEGVAELNPYYYSASKVTEIDFNYKSTRREIEVPLFKGERYKMIFNKKGLPKDILVEIFDKDNTHTNRNAVFTSKGNTAEILSYSPDKSKNMFIRYTIPKANGATDSGCIVFVLGYRLTFLGDDKEKNKEQESATE